MKGNLAACSASLLGNAIGASVTPLSHSNGTSGGEMCLTPNCVEAAAHVLQNLHPDYDSIDPCEDFDQYICGGFSSRFPGEETYDTIKETEATNVYLLKNILDSPYPGTENNDSDDKYIFDMLVQNYNSCMNVTSIKDDGNKGIMELLGEIDRLFPLSDEDSTSNNTISEEDRDAWGKVLVYLTKIGVPIFGEFWTIADPLNPDKMIPQFGLTDYSSGDHALPSAITIPTIAETEEDALGEVVKQVTKSNETHYSAADLLKFAKAIMEAAAPAEASVDDPIKLLYASSTVTEAAKKAPFLVLDKVIKELSPPDYKIDRMVFQYPETHALHSKIISETPKATLRTLLKVMTYMSYGSFLPESVIPEADRWETACFQYVDTSLPWIASKFFLDVSYSTETREYIETMAADLQDAFSARVSQLHWMKEETKKLVQEKLSNIITKIGYPQENPNTRDPASLRTYHTPLQITTSFFRNALNIRQWAVSKSWTSLSSPTNTQTWPEANVHSYKTAARYYPNYNAIHIPAGITQKPIYRPEVPSYLTYGPVGLVAGHEITHGFDTNGRFWNPEREYRDWWDESTEEEFLNRTDCFVQQYSGIPVLDHEGEVMLGEDGKKMYVNGNLTLAENIADAGGIVTAWNAWRHHEEIEPAKRLPGLEGFTKEQLFFISAGQVWCGKKSAEVMQGHLANNGHSPPLARIKGVTQNSRAFRETWQCKRKEPVCEIW